MSNDPAYYLAQRARDLYALSPRATMRELLRICRERGVAVEWDPELDREGWFVNCPRPLIVLKRRRCPWVLAHEIAHALLSGSVEYGAVAPFTGFAANDVEAVAERFACLLCGTFQERAQALLEF